MGQLGTFLLNLPAAYPPSGLVPSKKHLLPLRLGLYSPAPRRVSRQGFKCLTRLYRIPSRIYPLVHPYIHSSICQLTFLSVKTPQCSLFFGSIQIQPFLRIELGPVRGFGLITLPRFASLLRKKFSFALIFLLITFFPPSLKKGHVLWLCQDTHKRKERWGKRKEIKRKTKSMKQRFVLVFGTNFPVGVTAPLESSPLLPK